VDRKLQSKHTAIALDLIHKVPKFYWSYI